MSIQLIAKLLYGSGLRLSESLKLRIKDLDFAQSQIVVRDAKGNQSRVTMLPTRLQEPLSGHLQWVKMIHQQDLALGYGEVYLPYALERKYPSAERDWTGSMCFQLLPVHLTRAVASVGDIISVQVGYRKQ